MAYKIKVGVWGLNFCGGIIYYVGGLYRFGYVIGIRFVLENVVFKALVFSVYDEGKCVDIFFDVYEG